MIEVRSEEEDPLLSTLPLELPGLPPEEDEEEDGEEGDVSSFSLPMFGLIRRPLLLLLFPSFPKCAWCNPLSISAAETPDSSCLTMFCRSDAVCVGVAVLLATLPAKSRMSAAWAGSALLGGGGIWTGGGGRWDDEPPPGTRDPPLVVEDDIGQRAETASRDFGCWWRVLVMMFWRLWTNQGLCLAKDWS